MLRGDAHGWLRDGFSGGFQHLPSTPGSPQPRSKVPLPPRATDWVQKRAANRAGAGSKSGQEVMSPSPAGQSPNPAVLSLPLALLLLLCVRPLIRRQQSIRSSTRREQSDAAASEQQEKKKKDKSFLGSTAGLPPAAISAGPNEGGPRGAQVGPSSQSITGDALVALRLL